MNQSSTSSAIPKLYLLTNDDEFELLYQKLDAALSTGLIALLQIRRKQTLSLPDGHITLYEEAKQIVKLAKAHDVPVVMNDDIAIAAKLGIGVHLGNIELVKEAKDDGASYAAMGAIFNSTTKPNADIISRQKLIEGCQQDIPICVIGGLTAENISELAGIPIALVAVVGDIMDLPVEKIAERCYQWQQALSKWKTPAV